MNDLAALLYLGAGVLFILALRGLSSPATSRRGNLYGMIGMGVAVATTLLLRLPSFSSALLILIGAGAGGGVGAVVAQRIEMTKMPQLVAFFHSLVGLAAVLVAGSAFYAPQAFGIGAPGRIEGGSLFEMSLGASIGAITFTGSVIAFLKLDERMTGKPILLPGRHLVNIVLGISLAALILLFA
ncbi:MAG: NAD(P)(+) transhydrogenase (Re/Si-specific) subunit beta, partial [Methylocystis sp.]|nr:NAD(P)(+) transhydrogenase (Re/Si-specific) subunit beta [Methylocystis sp.]